MTKAASIKYFGTPDYPRDFTVEQLQSSKELAELRIQREELTGEIPDIRLYAEVGFCAVELAKLGHAENPDQLRLEPTDD